MNHRQPARPPVTPAAQEAPVNTTLYVVAPANATPADLAATADKFGDPDHAAGIAADQATHIDPTMTVWKVSAVLGAPVELDDGPVDGADTCADGCDPARLRVLNRFEDECADCGRTGPTDDSDQLNV